PNPYESTTTTTDDIATDSTVSPNPYESSSSITEDVATTTDPTPEPTTTTVEEVGTSTIDLPTPTPTPTPACDLNSPDARQLRLTVAGVGAAQKEEYRNIVMDQMTTDKYCFARIAVDVSNNFIFMVSFPADIPRISQIPHVVMVDEV
ncbi:hypothetical protein BJ085DRAFT_38873, partial [Dimargaris cristalligena]